MCPVPTSWPERTDEIACLHRPYRFSNTVSRSHTLRLSSASSSFISERDGVHCIHPESPKVVLRESKAPSGLSFPPSEYPKNLRGHARSSYHDALKGGQNKSGGIWAAGCPLHSFHWSHHEKKVVRTRSSGTTVLATLQIQKRAETRVPNLLAVNVQMGRFRTQKLQSKGKQLVGAAFCRKRSIEIQTAVTSPD